ncbi:MAG: hypothetical protein LBU70_04540 [Chitinispirillales bacterium]|jgi:hypothetical protein|nr:hypothetical protein [Chitinispirillales bacterium]
MSEERNKYQINATVESFDFESGKLRLKGIGKYCFEKENAKNKFKEYWNVFESLGDADEPMIFKKQDESIQIKISKIGIELGMQYLLNHAFTEKKGLMFKLELDTKSKLYSLIEVSHVSN